MPVHRIESDIDGEIAEHQGLRFAVPGGEALPNSASVRHRKSIVHDSGGYRAIPRSKGKMVLIRKLKVAMALMFMLGMVAAPVAAQDFDIENVEDLGLSGMYGRMYLTEAALTGGTGPMAVVAIGFSFEEAEVADEMFEVVTCGFAGGMLGIEGEGECDALIDAGIEVTDLDGIGDAAIELIGEVGDEADAQPALIVSTLSGNNIFLVVYLGDNEPGLGDAFAMFLADAEPVDTEVVFDADNNGTGGFFDMLPQEGDEVLEGLIPYQDMDLFSEISNAE